MQHQKTILSRLEIGAMLERLCAGFLVRRVIIQRDPERNGKWRGAVYDFDKNADESDAQACVKAAERAMQAMYALDVEADAKKSHH